MAPLFYSQAQVLDVEHTARVSNLAQPARWQDVSWHAVLKILTRTYLNAVFEGVSFLSSSKSLKTVHRRNK